MGRSAQLIETKIGVTTFSRDWDDQVIKSKEFSRQEDFVSSPATSCLLHWDQLKELWPIHLQINHRSSIILSDIFVIQAL